MGDAAVPTSGAMQRFGRYPEYRESGVEWLGEIPAHWEVSRNKHLFREIDDRSRTGGETLLSVSEYYGVKPRSDIVAEGEWITRAESLVGYKLCQPGDLAMNFMLAWKNGLGFSEYSGLVSPSYAVFRPVVNADYRYFHYLLRSMQAVREFKRYSYGIIDSRLRLYPDTFGSLRSPVPPLSEQRAISVFLDRESARIDALIAKQRELISLLQEKRRTVIRDAVTKGLDSGVPMRDSGVEWLGAIPAHWEVVQLRRVALDRCDGPFGSGLKSTHYAEDGVRVVRLQNIGHGDFEGADAAFIPQEHYSNLGDHSVLPGDLLIAGLGDTNHPTGRACVAPEGIGPAMVKADCFRFRLDQSRARPQFLALQLSATASIASGLTSTGATRQRTSLANTAARAIAIPDLQEQSRIVDSITRKTVSLDHARHAVHRAVAYLNEYRTALISAAVTGRIDVRKPQQTDAAHTGRHLSIPHPTQ